MLLSSSNTGSTDLRDTEVQQPNVAAHLSTEISWGAFSANSGQLDAGSTTTASSCLPSTPPALFCLSISISMTSFSVVSLIAMVPDKECRIPILIVPALCAMAGLLSVSTAPTAAMVAAAAPRRARPRRETLGWIGFILSIPCCLLRTTFPAPVAGQSDRVPASGVPTYRPRIFRRHSIDIAEIYPARRAIPRGMARNSAGGADYKLGIAANVELVPTSPARRPMHSSVTPCRIAVAPIDQPSHLGPTSGRQRTLGLAMTGAAGSVPSSL